MLRTVAVPVGLAEIEAAATDRPAALDVLAALAPAERVKIIAEVKRASPSRGVTGGHPRSCCACRFVRDRRCQRHQRAHRAPAIRRDR